MSRSGSSSTMPLGRHLRCSRLSATAGCFAAQGVVPTYRHPGGRRGDRGSDCMVPAGPRPVSRRAGTVGRRSALLATLLHNFASYAAALAGYTAAIIAADELGATGGPRRCGLPARSLPQRNLHRYRLCRRRSRRDRFRRRPAPPRRVIRGPIGRNHGPVYPHVGWNRFACRVGTSWRVDETYVKIKGKWTYLYRAVDKQGKTVDFLLRAKRDVAAAKAFFRRAFKSQGRLPQKITLDGYQASHRAAREILGEHQRGKRTKFRSSKYINNLIEQDHRSTKFRLGPMLGMKRFRSASITLAAMDS